MTDVVVIGGGVIGAACARSLALRGCRVTIYEPGPEPGAASPASAGMLAAQLETSTAEPLFGLGVRARDLYPTLGPLLQDTTGIDIRLAREGIAHLAFTEEEEARLKETVALQRQAGLPCDWLEADEVRGRWPRVSPEARGALFAPEDGAVDPQALTRALLADARRVGATLVPEKAARLVIVAGKFKGVETPSGIRGCDHVVIAAGCWSPLIAGLPRPLPVEPVRGQLASLPWPDDQPPGILYGGHGGYVVARGKEAIAGTTMEHAGFEVKVTNEGLAQIFRALTRIFPELAKVPVRRTWAGLRPMTPDGMPLIGPAPDVSGVWCATGHGRNGVLLAGLTGEILGDWITKGETEIDAAALSPARFT